ncbi:transcriptional regulator [Kosakonia sp. CCTCC M2018092]|nr:transcriptional regulator [Kosakonia sp. CCTCC M2018092]
MNAIFKNDNTVEVGLLLQGLNSLITNVINLVNKIHGILITRHQD